MKLVAGQMPAESSPYEVLASFTLQQDYGVHIGSVIHVPVVCIVTVAGTVQRLQRVPVRADRCLARRGDRCRRNGVSVRVRHPNTTCSQPRHLHTP